MVTTFWKMHGAGNDFILIDDRQNQFPDSDAKLINDICQRRTGIGCDGLILIRASSSLDFSMRFFNPDGNEAEMCGNGARCVSRLAHDIGVAGKSMSFETKAGTISAEVDNDSVKLYLTPATNLQSNMTLTLESGEEIIYDSLNTGVPHAVVQTKELSSYPVTKYGHAIIKHQAFAPEETNVNFAEICGPDFINVRTYERGVEDETLACGTGITATAITMAIRNLVQPPVSVKVASGDILVVDFKTQNNEVKDITLIGPAVYVFTGEIDIDITHSNKDNNV